MAASCFALTACDEVFGPTSEEEALLKEARAAISEKVKELGAFDFKEDKSTDIYPEKGLVCEDVIYSSNPSPDGTVFKRYYYLRGSGAYLPGEAEALPIMRACAEAFESLTGKFASDPMEKGAGPE